MKKKTDNFSKIVVLIILVTMLALIALSGTYAKYTTQASGTATAVIANWNISFKQGETTLAESFTIDLASTMKGKDKDNPFIQPGSKGEFTITVKNSSQVPANVSATLTNNTSSIFKKGQFTLTATGADGSSTEVAANGGTKDVTIKWEWKYDHEGADTDDTTLGTATDKTAKTLCNITLTATQVNPNPTTTPTV